MSSTQQQQSETGGEVGQSELQPVYEVLATINGARLLLGKLPNVKETAVAKHSLERATGWLDRYADAAQADSSPGEAGQGTPTPGAMRADPVEEVARLVSSRFAKYRPTTQELRQEISEALELLDLRIVPRTQLNVSAPEMLAVLVEADDYLSPNPLNSIGAGSILHSRFRAAIAKATSTQTSPVPPGMRPQFPQAPPQPQATETTK